MNKPILIIVLAIIAMGILFSVFAFIKFEPTTPYATKNDASSVNTSTETSNLPVASESSNSGQQTLPAKISQSQLASHSSRTDCWVGYNGKAYDLSSFLPRHPGSAGAISPYCGTSSEFEQAFKSQHGTSQADMFMKVSIYKGELA